MSSSITQTFTVWWGRHSGLEIGSPRLRAGRILRGVWALSLLLGGAFLLSRLAQVGEWRRAWSTSMELGGPLALLLALPAVGHFIKMLGWRGLIPREHRPPLCRAYVAFIAAQGINELGFSVLGEPVKVLVLSPEARSAGARAVVADNLAALAALFAVIATLACLGVAAAPLLLLGFIVLRRVREQSWSALLVAFLAHYLGKLWLVVEIGLGLYFLGEPAFRHAGQLGLAWLGAAAVGAPVPGQLGVVEAALVHAGGALGIAAPSLVALALIRRLRSLLWLVLGLLLAARIASRSSQPSKIDAGALDPHVA